MGLPMTESAQSRVAHYMQCRCICGRPRAEHAHFHDASGRLYVRAVTNSQCHGFLDELELALGGNPLLNPLLQPRAEENLRRWDAAEKG